MFDAVSDSTGQRFRTSGEVSTAAWVVRPPIRSAFLPAYVCAVWWRRANAPGALASILAGAGVSFVWQYAELVESTQLAPMLTGVLASSITIVVVSLLTGSSHPVPVDIVAAMDEADRVGPVPATLAAATNPDLATEAGEIGRAFDAEVGRD